MSSIAKVEIYREGPKYSDFTPEERKMVDLKGLQRTYMKITFKQLTDTEYFTIADIVKNQYALPIRYLKPIPNSYSYISQKSQISGKEKDIRNASITIEPLNCDFFNQISYTPINQSLPLGTVVTIDVSTPFDDVNGKPPERKFIWSKNLRTESGINSKIKTANPKSINTQPWLRCCHYGAIDIGSRLTAKYEVANVDTEIIKSFSLFGFGRSDERKEFTIWTFYCFNVTPVDILKLVKAQSNIRPETAKVIDEILSKCK